MQAKKIVFKGKKGDFGMKWPDLTYKSTLFWETGISRKSDLAYKSPRRPRELGMGKDAEIDMFGIVSGFLVGELFGKTQKGVKKGHFRNPISPQRR